MATLKELIKNYLEELVEFTNCTVTVVAHFAKYISEDEMEELDVPGTTPRKRARKLWNIVRNYPNIDINMLINFFTKQRQTGVLPILKKIQMELTLGFSFEKAITVKLQSGTKNTRRNENRYRINEGNPGALLVVNITKFRDPKNTRDGAQNDSHLLQDLFQQLKFSVYDFKEMGGCFKESEIEKVFEEYLPQVYRQKPSSLVVFIGSHMEGDQVYLSDDTALDLHDQFIKPICDRVELEGVPKVFFVQGCRASRRYSRSVEYNDTLICHSTLPGGYAFRNPYFGSIFVGALVHVLMTEAYFEDLLTMLDKVSHKMQVNAFDDQDPYNRQIPDIRGTLMHKLYLTTC